MKHLKVIFIVIHCTEAHYSAKKNARKATLRALSRSRSEKKVA